VEKSDHHLWVVKISPKFLTPTCNLRSRTKLLSKCKISRFHSKIESKCHRDQICKKCLKDSSIQFKSTRSKRISKTLLARSLRPRFLAAIFHWFSYSWWQFSTTLPSLKRRLFPPKSKCNRTSWGSFSSSWFSWLRSTGSKLCYWDTRDKKHLNNSTKVSRTESALKR
jgi:hypothetical protein